MTLLLRKIHRLVWLAWSVLLPLGWLAAIWVMPAPVWQDPVRPGQPPPLPVVSASARAGDFFLRLRQDSAGVRQQLEVFIQRPLPEGTVTVFLQGPPELALGALGARGVWRFALDGASSRRRPLEFRLEDPIRRRVLHKVAFR